MNDCIPVVTGARLYGVRSKSRPGQRHIVDLTRASCTCVRAQFIRGKDQLCEHQQRAVEFEQEQAQLQATMPVITARLRTERSGRPQAPQIEGLTEREILEIFR